MISHEELQEFKNIYGGFFEKFRTQHTDTFEHFSTWQRENPQGSFNDYIDKLFSEAFLYMSKYADTELEFSKWKLEITYSHVGLQKKNRKSRCKLSVTGNTY